MPTGPARTADEVTDNLRSIIDRMVESKFTQEMARRGQDVAGVIAERGAEVGSLAGSMASDAWKDSRPLRRDAAKRIAEVTEDASKWSEHTWSKSLRPALKDLWKRRTVAIGAAGAAVPVGRELVNDAAERLNLRKREERHWGAFFLGLLLGAAAGAIVAMLTTPKRGSEMRRELGERADEIATKAKEVEWAPIFQRDDGSNGHSQDILPGESLSGRETSTLQESAAATGEAAEEAAADTAEAINESYDTVDRESTS